MGKGEGKGRVRSVWFKRDTDTQDQRGMNDTQKQTLFLLLCGSAWGQKIPAPHVNKVTSI
jgi:hypothetical protein